MNSKNLNLNFYLLNLFINLIIANLNSLILYITLLVLKELLKLGPILITSFLRNDASAAIDEAVVTTKSNLSNNAKLFKFVSGEYKVKLCFFQFI